MNTTNNRGWQCPNCGKAHGPHVDTCPNVTTIDTAPNTIPPKPTKWVPDQTIPNMPMYPKTADPKIRCPKCGLVLGDVMAYVCMDIMCPVGLGPTTMVLNG